MCMIEARRMDEGPDAIPVDRKVVSEGGLVEVRGPYVVPLVITVVEGASGRMLDRRIAVAR